MGRSFSTSVSKELNFCKVHVNSWSSKKSIMLSSDGSEVELLVPPMRYGTINPGIYRGGYPTLRNYRFLSRLQLKTIISLTPEPPNADVVSFAQMSGANVVHHQIMRMQVLNDALATQLISAINICLDSTNHPVYIHCLDGRRITGLFVILMRRIQGWTPLPSLSEFWRYQVSNRSPIPTAEIEKTTKDLEKFCAECNDIVLPVTIPMWLWLGDKTTVVPGIKVKAPSAPSSATQYTSSTTASTSVTAAPSPSVAGSLPNVASSDNIAPTAVAAAAAAPSLATPALTAN